MMNKAVFAVAALALPATANAAILTNGNFESPVIASSCCNTVQAPGDPNGTALPGWDVPTGDVNVVNGTFGSAAGNLAFAGKQYLDLVGESNAGSIAQTFNTLAGRTYRLFFAYSHNIFSNGSTPTSASYSVGNLSGGVTHSTGSNTNLDWKTVETTFIAGPGTSSTLNFTNGAGTGSGGVFLDQISVSLVPEPATWAMMILGLGFVGGVMRRRRAPALKLA